MCGWQYVHRWVGDKKPVEQIGDKNKVTSYPQRRIRRHNSPLTCVARTPEYIKKRKKGNHREGLKKDVHEPHREKKDGMHHEGWTDWGNASNTTKGKEREKNHQKAKKTCGKKGA